MVSLKFVALSTAFIAFATPSFAQTTRIIGQNVYGATITKERGVNVIRPLPTTERVIINPGHKTPLSLSFSENRTYEYSNSTNHNYNHNSDPSGSIGGGGGAIIGIPGAGRSDGGPRGRYHSKHFKSHH
jgi:hypothetical protein